MSKKACTELTPRAILQSEGEIMGKSIHCCCRAYFGRSIKKTIITGIGILSFGLNAHAGENPLLDSLEKGSVLSNRAGSAILAQALVKKDAAIVAKAMGEDFKKLPSIFTGLAFARPFVTKDGKNLVYLKLRGLGDSTGDLMEMKQGPREAFTNARELLKSGDLGLREQAGELNEVPDTGVLAAISKTNQKNETQRMLGGDSVIILEGPLNEVQQMPNLRVTMAISIAPYSVVPPAKGVAGAAAPVPQNFTLMQVRTAFGRQVPTGGELGDYRGFGDHRLMIAQEIAESFLRSARSQLEKL